MSSSQTFKFAGSTIAVLTSFDETSPALAITGITNADPAVVSCAAHGLADGAVVKLSEILGMTELNNGVFVVNVLTAGTFELVDEDTTSYTAYSSGGEVAPGTFSNFCELTGYNRQGGSSPEIDTTSLCSNAAEYELGLPDFGTTQLDFKFAPQTTIQAAIANFYSGANKGNKMAVRVDLPNSGGRMVQIGRIQQTTEAAAVNGIWTGSMTVRNTGERIDFAAA
jgi:ubiquitin-activating enzyme E1-like protein